MNGYEKRKLQEFPLEKGKGKIRQKSKKTVFPITPKTFQIRSKFVSKGSQLERL